MFYERLKIHVLDIFLCINHSPFESMLNNSHYLHRVNLHFQKEISRWSTTLSRSALIIIIHQAQEKYEREHYTRDNRWGDLRLRHHSSKHRNISAAARRGSGRSTKLRNPPTVTRTSSVTTVTIVNYNSSCTVTISLGYTATNGPRWSPRDFVWLSQ